MFVGNNYLKVDFICLLPKTNEKIFCSANKFSHFFSAKDISILVCMCARRPNEFLTIPNRHTTS